MNKLTEIALFSMLLACIGCSGRDTQSAREKVAVNEAVKLEGLENKIRDLQIINGNLAVSDSTDGLYLNHGVYLPPKAQYRLWGVDGCNAMVLYVENKGMSHGAVTHYQPDKENIAANLDRFSELCNQHPALLAGEKYLSLFYAKPTTPEDEKLVLIELYFITKNIKLIFGEDIKVRYLSYDMEPPGSKIPIPSLIIDFGERMVDSEWHDQMSLKFREDESYKVETNHLSEEEKGRIKQSVLSWFTNNPDSYLTAPRN